MMLCSLLSTYNTRTHRSLKLKSSADIRTSVHCSHCCTLICVQTLAQLLTHKLGQQLLNPGHPGATAHQDHLVNILHRHAGCGQGSLNRTCNSVHQVRAHLHQLFPAHGELEVNIFHYILNLGKTVSVGG